MPDYAVHIERHDEGFVATLPDLPEAAAVVGASYEDALNGAAKSLEEALRRRFLSEQEIPEPRAEGSVRLRQEVLATVFA